MTIEDALSIDLLVAGAGFVSGYAIPTVRKHLHARRFRSFFGEAVVTDQLKVVYGVYHSLPLNDDSEKETRHRFLKRYSREKQMTLRGPSRVVTPDSIDAYRYVARELDRYRKDYVPLCPDDDATENLDATFISIGGEMTNALTDMILKHDDNKYFEFDIPKRTRPDGTVSYAEGPITLKTKGAYRRTYRKDAEYDYGIVLKMRNSWSPSHLVFVCAGIGSSGTSGAGWYLSHHWSDLLTTLGTEDFGAVLRVNRGSDTSATPVFPDELASV